MKISVLQMPVVVDKSENLAEAERLIKLSVKAGADIAVLPEMFCCPYSNDYFTDYAEPVGGEIWNFLSKAAKEYSIYLVGGSMPEIDVDKIYNTCFVFNRNGEQIARHRKVHLFNVDIEGGQRFFESETFTAGDDVTVFDTEFGKIGLCICFDLRFPELSRSMTLKGASMVIVPAAFNMTTGPMHWETMFRQRAVDDQLFTVGASPAHNEQGIYVSYANSIVCDPWGRVMARAGFEPEVITAEIDFSEIPSARKQLPLLSARRPEVY